LRVTESGELMLEPGDTLVAYSDGVLERRNRTGEEFGLERLMTSALEVRQPSAHATLMMLLATFEDFANGNPLSDDVSLTVIHRDADRRTYIGLSALLNDVGSLLPGRWPGLV